MDKDRFGLGTAEDGMVRMAHKGRTWFELTMHGATAHASTPWRGADAVAASAEAIKHVCDVPDQTAAFTGCTDSSVVAGLCHNPNCASYGPGSLEVAHKPNEHVPLADLARIRAVYRDLALHALWG